MKAKLAHIQPIVFSANNRKRKRYNATLDRVFAIVSALIAIGLGLLAILSLPQP